MGDSFDHYSTMPHTQLDQPCWKPVAHYLPPTPGLSSSWTLLEHLLPTYSARSKDQEPAIFSSVEQGFLVVAFEAHAFGAQWEGCILGGTSISTNSQKAGWVAASWFSVLLVR